MPELRAEFRIEADMPCPWQAEVKLIKPLAGPLGQLQNTAMHIGELQQAAKLPVDPEEFRVGG